MADETKKEDYAALDTPKKTELSHEHLIAKRQKRIAHSQNSQLDNTGKKEQQHKEKLLLHHEKQEQDLELVVEDNTTNTINGHGGERDTDLYTNNIDAYLGTEVAGSGNSHQKKKKSQLEKTVLRQRRQSKTNGPFTTSAKALPGVFLGIGHIRNSFFSFRLLMITLLIALVDSFGLFFFYYHYFQWRNSEEATSQGCLTILRFCNLVYHPVGVTILLGLPATGLRCFDIFARDGCNDAKGRKVKRTLFLQCCELVAAGMIIYWVGVLVFFLNLFFGASIFRCVDPAVVGYAMFAFLLFLSTFVQLNFFARLREHIKMQLGAFREADQTGNIRNRLETQEALLESKESQVIHTIRKRLLRSAQNGNIKEMEAVIKMAQQQLGNDFATEYYKEPHIWMGLFGKSKKNPMHVAALMGNIEALEKLYSAGFGVNTFDKVSRVRFSTGDLFWYFASFVVKKNSDQEDDIASSIFKTTLITPLHCATNSSRVKTVQWLIAHGAEVNTVAKSSYRSERLPAIFMAEHPDIVTMLLKAGANHLTVPDPGFLNTITALELAYLRENYAVGAVLEEWGGDIALTPLHVAAAANNEVKVIHMLSKGVDPNCIGEQGYAGLTGRTPLHWAATNGSVKSAKRLLEKKADVSACDREGRTPLHWAARLNQLDMVNLLVSWDSNVNLPDGNDLTPLMCAAAHHNASKFLFMTLINKGADVNYQLPQTGDTALHLAIEAGHQETSLALLEAGSDIMKTNHLGYRPLDCTTNTGLQFAVKKAAGTRDVMISYTHSHSQFAKKIRKSLEQANVTTWLDLMDPSGIGGGSVWREEIARGISNAAVVLCLLTEDYVKSEWCLKELAYAKQVGTPIMAISSEGVQVNEDLQVYLYTRQMIPFEKAITAVDQENKRNVLYTYDEKVYAEQFMQVLDGVRDEVEKTRQNAIMKSSSGEQRNSTVNGTFSMGISASDIETNSEFVFISHGDCNSEFVQKVYLELTNRNVPCYLDHTGKGSDMTARIRTAKEAILKCSCFIVVLSQKSSGNELVNDQLAFAEDKKKPILPILFSEPELGLGQRYTLARNEVYNFSKGIGFQSSFQTLFGGVSKFFTASSTRNSYTHSRVSSRISTALVMASKRASGALKALPPVPAETTKGSPRNEDDQGSPSVWSFASSDEHVRM